MSRRRELIPLMRIAMRWLAAAFFVLAGLNHFRHPTFYDRIVPPMFPAPRALVTVSGVCEIAGGLGLLARRLRVAAGWGLLALLVAVFPANVYMAMHPEVIPELRVPAWLLWLRLPIQPLLMAWVRWISHDRGSEHGGR